MRTYSNIKPENYEISVLGNGSAEILFAENITQAEDEFKYDLYTITVPYRENLADDIAKNLDLWFEMAKNREESEPEYTSEQILQQDITDLQLDNIEQGQQITDLELMMFEG